MVVDVWIDGYGDYCDCFCDGGVCFLEMFCWVWCDFLFDYYFFGYFVDFDFVWCWFYFFLGWIGGVLVYFWLWILVYLDVVFWVVYYVCGV